MPPEFFAAKSVASHSLWFHLDKRPFAEHCPLDGASHSALAYWLAAWYVLHVPAVYGYALTHRWALGLEHLAFLTSGIAFWWPVLTPGRMAAHAKLVYLFGAFIAASPVSLALALTHPQYGFYVHAPKLWGLSPLEDQQVGAIAMAIEQAAILFAACSIVFFRMLAEDEAGDAGIGFEA